MIRSTPSPARNRKTPQRYRRAGRRADRDVRQFNTQVEQLVGQERTIGVGDPPGQHPVPVTTMPARASPAAQDGVAPGAWTTIGTAGEIAAISARERRSAAAVPNPRLRCAGWIHIWTFTPPPASSRRPCRPCRRPPTATNQAASRRQYLVTAERILPVQVTGAGAPEPSLAACMSPVRAAKMSRSAEPENGRSVSIVADTGGSESGEVASWGVRSSARPIARRDRFGQLSKVSSELPGAAPRCPGFRDGASRRVVPGPTIASSSSVAPVQRSAGRRRSLAAGRGDVVVGTACSVVQSAVPGVR